MVSQKMYGFYWATLYIIYFDRIIRFLFTCISFSLSSCFHHVLELECNTTLSPTRRLSQTSSESVKPVDGLRRVVLGYDSVDGATERR